MRKKLLWAGLALVVVYLVLGVSAFGHSNPVHYTWTGTGTHRRIDFIMPSDPMPLISSNPWTLTYRVRCYGLQSPAGAPPGFSAQDTLRVDLAAHGSGLFFLGSTTGASASTSLFSDSRTWSFDKGGTWTLGIHAQPQCHWTVTAATTS
jgi:hypothetical protein